VDSHGEGISGLDSQAKEDLEEVVPLRTEECPTGGEGRDSPPDDSEEEVEEDDSDSEDQGAKPQEEESDDDAALSEEELEDPVKRKVERKGDKPPKAKVGKAAWSARPYQAKQWVDNLKLRLGEGGMWCYLQKKGNLNLCTINVNGNTMGLLLQEPLKKLGTRKDCLIDGIVLVDTRTPEDQVRYQSRAWQAAFWDQETFSRILAGQSNCDRKLEKKVHGRIVVSGSTLLFFPRPDLRVRTITYDPANLGILTCVTIWIGQTDSVLWIAVYTPFRGEKQEGEALEGKLRAWYFKCRALKMDSGGKRAASKWKFDAISWIWDILIPDRVACNANTLRGA
jgi:hypothetical protein